MRTRIGWRSPAHQNEFLKELKQKRKLSRFLDQVVDHFYETVVRPKKNFDTQEIVQLTLVTGQSLSKDVWRFSSGSKYIDDVQSYWKRKGWSNSFGMRLMIEWFIHSQS